MPPKADSATADNANVVKGFDARETKLLAAAFLSSIAPGKYDYTTFESLTGNTAGSLRKMFPPVKRKAVEVVPSFGTFLGEAGEAGEAKDTKAAPAKADPTKAQATKGARSKKRKAEDDEANADNSEEAGKVEPNAETANPKKKKATSKSRGRSKTAENKVDVKSEEVEENDTDEPI